jgi:hypothetical protein
MVDWVSSLNLVLHARYGYVIVTYITVVANSNIFGAKEDALQKKLPSTVLLLD